MILAIIILVAAGLLIYGLGVYFEFLSDTIHEWERYDPWYKYLLKVFVLVFAHCAVLVGLVLVAILYFTGKL